jgi:DNA-binding FadR family transcriptional regulator
MRILSGELDDGGSVGLETDLVAHYGVSRPCLREALRIVETEGLITVARGSRGGVIAHAPDGAVAARMAAMVLQVRNVPLADVHAARAYLEPAAARELAGRKDRRAVVARLAQVIDQQDAVGDEPAGFAAANAAFHHALVAEIDNETLAILAGMLDEILKRSVVITDLARDQSARARQLATRSQRKLLELIEAGDEAGAEAHWRAHLNAVGPLILGDDAETVVDPVRLDRS